MGSFSLEVESSLSFDLKAIPQEGAGMYTKTIKGAWYVYDKRRKPSSSQDRLQEFTERNGRTKFQAIFAEPNFRNRCSITHRVEVCPFIRSLFCLITQPSRVRLQLLRPKSTTAVNLTILPSSATGSLGRHLATSGGYDDSIAGVATPQISLSVGKYWVITSTYNPGFQGAFQLIVYSTASRVNIAERAPSNR
jgi:calpain-7